MCYPGLDPGPVMPKVPGSRWVWQLWGYGFKEKITIRVVWSWLVHTGVATSSNIFVPSTHSEGESLSQVPRQTCGPRELVKPATHGNIDGHLLSLGLTS